MHCRLCLEEKKLLKKSHILPEFFYEGMYNEYHKVVHTNLNNLHDKKHYPTGLYEKNILCAECDGNLLSSFETYAAEAFFKPNGKRRHSVTIEPLTGNDGLKMLSFSNLDYTKFKLFLLSLLWRSGLSNHLLFKQVELGCHAAFLREMLYTRNAGEETDYQTCIYYLNMPPYMIQESIIEPASIDDDGNTMIVFYLKGWMIHYNLEPVNKLEIFDKGCIGKDHKMIVPILEGDFAVKQFDAYLKRKIRLKSKMPH